MEPGVKYNRWCHTCEHSPNPTYEPPCHGCAGSEDKPNWTPIGIRKFEHGGFDPVEKPAHYNQGGIECIDAIEIVTKDTSGPGAYLIGNAMKYIWRHAYKGKPLEDLRKAVWYINRYIQHLEKNDA